MMGTLPFLPWPLVGREVLDEVGDLLALGLGPAFAKAVCLY